MTCKGRGRPEGGNRNLRKNGNNLEGICLRQKVKTLKVTMAVS